MWCWLRLWSSWLWCHVARLTGFRLCGMVPVCKICCVAGTYLSDYKTWYPYTTLCECCRSRQVSQQEEVIILLWRGLSACPSRDPYALFMLLCWCLVSVIVLWVIFLFWYILLYWTILKYKLSMPTQHCNVINQCVACFGLSEPSSGIFITKVWKQKYICDMQFWVSSCAWIT